MKILVLPSWYPPNGGWFFREHAQSLAAEGHQVDVLAGLYTSLRRTSPMRWIKESTLTVNQGSLREITRLCPIIPFSERLNYHSWVRTMLLFYDEYWRQWGHPDIIQVHSSLWAGVVASKIQKKYKVPYIITEHRSRFVNNTQEAMDMFRPWYMMPLREAFKGAQAIVTVSEALHAKVTEILPAAEEKLKVIYNMVDTEFFAYPGKKPLPQKPFKIFSLAYLEFVKGIDILIEAFSILHREHPGMFHLTIGGDGTERNALVKLSSSLGLSKHVEFIGKLSREQVKGAMHKADLFVLPSRFEAFGVVYIEAMASGLPVIATRSGGPETFITGDVGLVVPSEKPAELASAILRIQSGYKNYNANAIGKYAKMNFDKQKIAHQYIELYRKVVEKTNHE